MSQNKTWYVIATWSGKRRGTNLHYDTDQTYYLRYHIAQLNKLKHSLNRVLVMVPHNEKEPPIFTKYIQELSDTQGIQVIRRENAGLSYGSWSDAFTRSRDLPDRPDWWIFMEDDYVFTLDNFDEKMQDLFLKKDNCGFLCGLAWKSGLPFHAGISNGITRHEVLDKVWGKDRRMPHLHFPKGDAYHGHDQVEFSQAFVGAKFNLCDTRGCYCIAFSHMGVRAVIFHDRSLPLLMAPIQYLELIENPESRNRKEYGYRVLRGKEGDE
jgi:hypothetical protein